MEKRWPIFLLDLASCTTVHAALGSARTVCGSQLMTRAQCVAASWWEGHRRFEDWPHLTLLLPLSGVLCLESVMSDKMCVCASARASVCVCVCVCVCTDSFQAGFPNRFLCFLNLSGIFGVSQRTCSQNQCFFLSSCLFLLPCSQTYILPLPLSACFPRLAWICVPPSCQIRLLFGCLDSEPNTTVNTVRAKSKHHEVLARSIKKQRCLLCSWERSCSFPIKNGLKHYILVNRLSWRAEPREGVVFTLHHWADELLNTANSQGGGGPRDPTAKRIPSQGQLVG